MKTIQRVLYCAVFFFFTISICASASDKERLYRVGIAKVDITPSYSVRLCGYRERKNDSYGVAQHIWAKAIAIEGINKNDAPSVLITVDGIGIPGYLRDEVACRLKAKNGINPDRVAICSTHSHTAPSVIGVLKTMFSDLSPEVQGHIERYTNDLTDSLEAVALRALNNFKPSELLWAQGTSCFAKNRRGGGGPVDNDLPMLVVRDTKGDLRAILLSYACHATSLNGDFNKICGDWPGYAQDILEAEHPGVQVMVSIGCGADANPEPRGKLSDAKNHGEEIASNINQLLAGNLTSINGKLNCKTKLIEVPIDKPPSFKKMIEDSVKGNNVDSINLKTRRANYLPINIPYLVQVWSFGNDLAMVFLPGEVVVDYSIRLKKEFAGKRLWINAYSNDQPCYIPSEQVLKEGGYEGGGAMIFYGWPSQISPGVEDNIVHTVHELMPQGF